MLVFQPVALELVGLVLRLLLEPAGPAGQLVLLLAALAAGVEGDLVDRGEVVDDLAQLVKLLPDGGKLFGVGREVIAVAATGLAAAEKKRKINMIISALC